MSPVGAALILAALWASGALAGERTKRFEKAFCTFTLPSRTWRWKDASSVANGVFAAFNEEEGLALGLTAQPCPEEAEVSKRSIPRFEKAFLKKGVVAKAGGKLMTFRGVPCYQLQLDVLPSDQSAVARVFIAHGLAYQFQLVGGEEPVWERPDLDAIFGGFQFIRAPEPPPPATSAPPTSFFSGTTWKIVLVGLLGALVGLIPYWIARRGPRKPAPGSGQGPE